MTIRRVPTQARGRERVAAIVAAAEAVFGEAGYETATTNAIAARAGVPVGSIYQYFADKQALLHAVADDYATEMLAVYDALLMHGSQDPHILAGELLDGLAAFGSARFGFTRIVLSAGAHPHLAGAVQVISAQVADKITQIIAERAPHLAPSAAHTIAQTVMTTKNAMLGLAIQTKEQTGYPAMEAVLHETRLLLGAYLAARMRG